MNRFINILSVIILVTACGAMSAAAQDPVRLVYAAPFDISSVSGVTGGRYIDVYAHVNISYSSLGSWSPAVVHYQPNGVGAWTDMAMEEIGNYGTHKTYYARLPVDHARLAIKVDWNYAVSGMSFTHTYWDNNGGADYHVRPYGGSGASAGLVGGYVGLVRARNYSVRAPLQPLGGTLYDQYIEGTIVVQATSTRRVTGIRMTTNNWTTWTDVSATGGGDISIGYGSYNVRVYTFNQRIHIRTSKPNKTVRFAVRYLDEASGLEYWDSNFGNNYTVKAGETVR